MKWCHALPALWLAIALTAPTASAAALSELEWLQGTWQGRVGEGAIEEIWSARQANAMLGIFRWTSQGKVIVYELLLLSEEDDAVVYRFKHFDAALTGWEQKDRPITLTLVAVEEGAARFVETGTATPLKLEYQRVGRKGLRVVLTVADGAVSQFDYRRQR